MRVGEVDERESERRVKKARNKGEIRKKESRKPRAKERERVEKGGWKELACLAQEYKEK